MPDHEAASTANTSAIAAEVIVSKQGKRRSCSIPTAGRGRSCDEKGRSERQLVGEWIKEPEVLHPPIWSKNLEEGWRDGPVHQGPGRPHEELGIYSEDNREPLKDLNRRVTWSDLHFGKNTLVENN